MKNDSYWNCQCPVFDICIFMEEYVSIITSWLSQIQSQLLRWVFMSTDFAFVNKYSINAIIAMILRV